MNRKPPPPPNKKPISKNTQKMKELNHYLKNWTTPPTPPHPKKSKQQKAMWQKHNFNVKVR